MVRPFVAGIGRLVVTAYGGLFLAQKGAGMTVVFTAVKAGSVA